ncbi:IQ domain-containing protein H isoform X2 [Ambystoma mexicanum]|uniref:IQ domain-containing protein H isoform X2 n=1 Tax=Ambystoma mexicanum TaxID=8296 RepID=UPI0037E885D0
MAEVTCCTQRGSAACLSLEPRCRVRRAPDMAGLGAGGVGHILVQVQEDLRHLKKRLTHISIQEDGGIVDIQALETAIHRTELGLRKHTEEYLQTLNSRVLTIASGDTKERNSHHLSKWGPQMDAAACAQKPLQHPQMPDNRAPAVPPMSRAVRVSAGAQHKLAQSARIMLDPENCINRSTLHQNFGITLPLISRRRGPGTLPLERIARGSTVNGLLVLPASHRKDASLPPPPVPEKDAKKGLQSLLERGLIPPSSHLTLVPNPVSPHAVPLHDFHKVQKTAASATGAARAGALNNPHIIPEARSPADKRPLSTHTMVQGNIAPPPTTISGQTMKLSKQLTRSSDREMSVYMAPDMQIQRVAPTLLSQTSPTEHCFTIYEGAINHHAPDFLAFKQRYCLSWGSIMSFLESLQALLKDYAVQAAIVNGEKVMEALLTFELNQRPTQSDLLSVLANRAAVKRLLSRPGQRYRGKDGRLAAATKIQATWRRHRDRLSYLEYRRHKWAAGVIAISWLLHLQKARVKRILKESRQRHLENFRLRAKHLAVNWEHSRTSRRTVIHVPSLGYSEALRADVQDLDVQQNLQLGRLCDIIDPNVDVIYVSPVEMNDEMLQYYSKLLGLQAAIRSGNPNDEADMQNRFRILTPEAINSFPTHHMCLATLLKYSPKTLKRIKNLIQGKEAYMVGGVLHKDDLAVADILKVPILGSEPDVARLYSTKSGSKRIFANAGVPMPPGEYDVYSLQQVFEVLSQLITDNLDVNRWLFKVDESFGGHGTAYCDIARHLPCYAQALKEFRRYGHEKWIKKWAQEPTLIRIAQELPEVLAQHAQPISRKRFPTWEKFLQAFLSQGGVIEAFPPADSITNLTVDMIIEPSGQVRLVSSGDQVHGHSPLQSLGTSVPQSSVDPDILGNVCLRIGEACKSRGVMGYFSVDLVTFICPRTMEQQVWATDLDLSYSTQLALTQLMLYMTNGTLDSAATSLQVPSAPKAHERPRHRREEQVEQVSISSSRSAVMSSHLMHSNLSTVYYNVFFQMCKAHGIGYDVKEKQGTVFILYENRRRQHLGMLTIGEDLPRTLMTFAQNLFIIHQEISAPNMQGESNFKEAVHDIESILGTAEENKLTFERERALAIKEAPAGST